MFLAYGFKVDDRPAHIEADTAASHKACRGLRRARIARGFRAMFSRTRREADFERFVEQHGPFKRYLP